MPLSPLVLRFTDGMPPVLTLTFDCMFIRICPCECLRNSRRLNTPWCGGPFIAKVVATMAAELYVRTQGRGHIREGDNIPTQDSRLLQVLQRLWSGIVIRVSRMQQKQPDQSLCLRLLPSRLFASRGPISSGPPPKLLSVRSFAGR